MGSTQDNEQRPLELEYAPVASFFQHRWFVRALIYTAIIVAVISLRKPASRFIANWNLNRLVAASVDDPIPSGTVIYSAKVDPATGTITAQTVRRVASWDTAQAAQTIAALPRHPAAATLFVGNAPPQFAHSAEVFSIDLQFNHHTPDNREGTVQVEIRTGRRDDAGRWMIGQFCSFPLVHLGGEWEAISFEAAQLDPSDPNHLKLDMIVDGNRHTFDILLRGKAMPITSARTLPQEFHDFGRKSW